MIKSMTGYGKGRSANETLGLTVEIKSVNHRFCDVSVKAPRSLMGLEAEIKKKVGERLRRGKIDVFVNQEMISIAPVVPTLNRTLAGAYVELFEQMRTEFAVDGGIPLGLLAAQKDVVVLCDADLDTEMVGDCLAQALRQALDSLEAMRSAEGEATGKAMESYLDSAEGLLGEIEKRAPEVSVEWKEKLTERLGRLSKDFEYDPQRVAQEIALFADRCDISEEVVRFNSHLDQFRKLFAQNEPVGRQMDFLLQELNRETNTMGSKSNDAELTRRVVSIKADLEKIREQVQNIE